MTFYLRWYDSSFSCDTVDQRTKVPCDLYLSVFTWIPFPAISFLDLGLPFINEVETENPDLISGKCCT